MISIRLQIFIAIAVFAMAGIILRMISKEKIDLRYAIGWLFLLLLALAAWLLPSPETDGAGLQQPRQETGSGALIPAEPAD